MTTTHTRSKFITAIAAIATPTVLFLGAATAHAVGSAHTIPTNGGSYAAFNPQPDPPTFPDRGNAAGIGNPNDHPSLQAPGGSIGLGGPDTLSPRHA